MANKLFGTDGVRGVANVFPMTNDFAMKLAMALGKVVCNKAQKVAIGKDTRISSDMLEASLCAGFTAMGVDVVLWGVVPTPAVTALTPEAGVDMAVMITASHNPYYDNGIKLIAADGNKFSDEMTATIEDEVQRNNFVFDKDKIGRIIRDNSVVEKYVMIAEKTATSAQGLSGMKLVLDCANGSFSAIMPQVYKNLGAEVIAIANEPDGVNINCDCGSMHPQKMMQKVVEEKADLGIAVDGDGDRIIVCDEKGNKVNSEQIIGFLTQYLDKRGELKGRAVVSTVLSNTALERFVKNMGLEYYSTKVGERHVVSKMQEMNGALGGEESGHLVVADYCKSGDALIVSLLLSMGLLEDGRKMSEIFPLFEFDPFKFVNIKVQNREQVKQLVKNVDFVKLWDESIAQMGKEGRVVIHPSGTEPKIRVWVSGKQQETVENISDKLVNKLEELKKMM